MGLILGLGYGWKVFYNNIVRSWGWWILIKDSKYFAIKHKKNQSTIGNELSCYYDV